MRAVPGRPVQTRFEIEIEIKVKVEVETRQIGFERSESNTTGMARKLAGGSEGCVAPGWFIWWN